MTSFTNINDNGWTLLGTGLSVCILQPNGNCRVYVGNSAPSVTAVGFFVPSGQFVQVPEVQALGGGVWVRGDEDEGSLVYATALQ